MISENVAWNSLPKRRPKRILLRDFVVIFFVPKLAGQDWLAAGQVAWGCSNTYSFEEYQNEWSLHG